VEKLVYAVWKRPSEDDASLAARLLGEAAPRLRARSERLRVSVVDDDVAAGTKLHLG
jgi:hypothetical protein